MDTNSTSKPVRLDMTGEQFKTLIEKRTQDGRIDTIPEIMDALSSMPDDKPMEDIINESASKAVSEAITEETATSSDIDEIFD